MSREAELEKEGISLLGNQKVKYPDQYAPEILETFLNKHPGNDYFVKFNCPEFTSLCPITGQPDFATITISYVPGERMVESKSLKLYLFSFRNHGDFHEDCVNVIMKDLIRLMDPKYIEVWGKFTPRGGISIDPYCNYGKPGTRWEEVAWQRLSQHDLYPEKVDNLIGSGYWSVRLRSRSLGKQIMHTANQRNHHENPDDRLCNDDAPVLEDSCEDHRCHNFSDKLDTA